MPASSVENPLRYSYMQRKSFAKKVNKETWLDLADMIKGFIIWSTTRVKMQRKEVTPSFSKNLSTLRNYIRKWRMDKGIS